jgi:hypothetical protein
MPPRLVCVAILLYWAVAASALIQRDVLPELTFVRPPDLRTIAHAEENGGPVRWSVEVIDNPLSPENRRSVGQALTESRRRPDGCVEITSSVSFDAGGLLKGTPLGSRPDENVEVTSHYQIDPSGNLRSFLARVTTPGDSDDWLRVEGTLKNRAMEIVARGKLPILNQTRTLPYPARGLVQNALGPFDRLPNLQVGQRWETQMVSPLTGRVDMVRVDVTKKCVIHWDRSPVTVFEVVYHFNPLFAKTWVRPDGLILRQEVPFPFVKLILERLPERTTAPISEVSGR